MTQIVLDGTQITSFVGQRVATSMAQHVRMNFAKSGPLASPSDQVIHALARKLVVAFGDEQPR